MKVLFFSNTAWYIFNFRLDLLKRLRNQGYETVIITPDDEYVERLRNRGFHVIVVRMQRRSLNIFKEVMVVLNLWRIFRKERPDVVHNFTIKCVVYGSFAALFAGVPYKVNAIAGLGHVFSSRSVIAIALRPLVKLLLSISLKVPGSTVIVQNSVDMREIIKANGARSENVKLIRGSGVDVMRFKSQREVNGSEINVLLASRMLWAKGIKEYVEAVKIVKRKYANVNYLLAGTPDEGSPDSIASEQLKGWDREGHIKYLGHVSDIQKLLASTTIVVLPSRYGEGVPRILIEAAAMGIPIVASDIPGCREIVKDGVNGVLISSNKHEDYAEAIETLLGNADVCLKMGLAGRRLAKNEFCERIVNQATIATYSEHITYPNRYADDTCI